MTERNIRESLSDQLKAKGADVDVYRSMVEDYVWLWKQLQKMKSDIRKRGFTYEAASAAGKKYEKDNPSVKNALLYSRQMVTIMNALGLDTSKVVGGEVDADDDL